MNLYQGYYPHYCFNQLAERKPLYADLLESLNKLPLNDVRVMAMTLTIKQIWKEQDANPLFAQDPFSLLDILATTGDLDQEYLLNRYYQNVKIVASAYKRMLYQYRTYSAAAASAA